MNEAFQRNVAIIVQALQQCQKARMHDHPEELLMAFYRRNQHIQLFSPTSQEQRPYRRAVNSVVNCSLCGWAANATKGMRAQSMQVGDLTDAEVDALGYYIAVDFKHEPSRIVGVFHGTCTRVIRKWLMGSLSVEELANLTRELLDSKRCGEVERPSNMETVSVVDYVGNQ